MTKVGKCNYIKTVLKLFRTSKVTNQILLVAAKKLFKSYINFQFFFNVDDVTKTLWLKCFGNVVLELSLSR